MAPRDTLAHKDTERPEVVEGAEVSEAPETAIFIGDTGLTMYSTGQLSWQHIYYP